MEEGSSKRATPAKRTRFTPAVLEMRPPKAGRVERRDDLSPLWLRVSASGHRSFSIRARIKGQAQPIRVFYPEDAHISNLETARVWALEVKRKCHAGIDPNAERRSQEAAEKISLKALEGHLLETVAAAYLATKGKFKKNARGWKERTYKEYDRAIHSVILPRWRGRQIHHITRDEISDFILELAETAPVGANRTLAVLSSLMGWYEKHRGSNFTSPIVRGMAPTEETARERILSDDELRIVWHVAGKTGTFGGIVRQLLLCAARRGEVAAMRHSQIGQDGIWNLPGEFTKNHVPLFLPLSAESLAVIKGQSRVDGQDIVFSVGGKCEFKNWGHTKAGFDKRVLWRLKAKVRAAGGNPADVRPLPHWTLHDLRRTAKSLMSRAKVRPDHSERVLNHVIEGVAGVYDRHSYEDEKRDALKRLARLLRQIISRESAKIASLRAASG